jgi:hypothetical protein
MSPRFRPFLTGTLAILVVAGCSGATAIPAIPAGPTPVAVPAPTVVPVPTFRPEPTPTPIIGEVDGDATGPQLVVVPVDATTISASIEDAAAKAWRVEVRGTGDQAGDAWVITVETSDVGPLITATEIAGGRTVGELDLTGFWDGTAAAGGCHSTLPVCLDTYGFRVPDDGDGSFAVQLHLEDPAVALTVGGAAAYWDGEPFVLGPWHETEAFPWGPSAG